MPACVVAHVVCAARSITYVPWVTVGWAGAPVAHVLDDEGKLVYDVEGEG